MKHWYAVQTHQRAEDQALLHLRRQNFEAYLPKCMTRRRHARRIEDVAVPLFPRYAFVRMDIGAERWRAVQSTVGVSRLVCHGEVPAFVPDGVIDDIRGRENDAGVVNLFDENRFKPGDRLTIKSGVFADHEGVFECLDGAHRVVLLLGLLGRELRVRLPQEVVSAA